MGRDPEYLAFVRMVDEHARAAAGVPIERERAEHAAAMARLERRGVAALDDLVVDGGDGPLRARLYRPELGDAPATLVYLHGGGGYLGTVDSWDAIVRELAVATGLALLSVEYRLAPEHPFPAAVEDAVAAVRWARRHAEELGATPASIGVGGDSAGANLATVAARRLRDAGEPPLRLALLVYPLVDVRAPPPPVDDPDGLDVWGSRADVRARYLAGADPASPDASPLAAADLAGLPPTVLVTAEYDRLRPQGLAYAERLRADGVPVTVVDAAGLDHGFLAWTRFAARPAAAVAEIGDAVRGALA